MHFDPSSIVEYATPRNGRFPFTVVTAEERVSKNGNPMIALELSVKIDGATIRCFDQLVDTPKALFRVRAFCRSIGRVYLFDRGQITPNVLLNASGVGDFDVGEEITTTKGMKIRPLEVVAYIPAARQATPPTEEPSLTEPPPGKPPEGDLPF